MNDGQLRPECVLGQHSVLRRHFGYGVAKVALAPDPASGPSWVRPSLVDALGAVIDEVRSAGLVGSVRKTVTTMGTGLVGSVLLVLVFLMLSRDFQDPDLEIVRFEPEPVPQLLQPAPMPTVAEPELPVPIPPPPVVAETPPPPEPVPEPPPVVTRTPAPPPKPVMPPAPPPQTTLARVAPQRPGPPPPAARRRPRVRIDAVSKPPPTTDPAPAPTRATRPEISLARAAAPDLSVDPVAAQEFEVAKSSRTAPTPRRAPAPRRKPSPTPSLAPSPLAAPDPGLDSARSSRSTRSVATSRNSSRRPPGALPSFAAAPAPTPHGSEAPARSVRIDPVREVARADSRGAGPGDDISGVALGTLAACVSDREEDRLKLAVMAAARGRAECASRGGRYRFVETKNLNAFLMWIERAESSPPGDRCVELGLALECLQNQGRRGANRT
jgi:hypothetical protein